MLTRFAPLPQPMTACGTPRRVGVEIELGGLGERRTAEIVAASLGGVVTQRDEAIWHVRDSDIGDIDVFLDIFLRESRKSPLRDAALQAGRDVVPVEIVTRPLDRDGLIRLDGLRDDLRRAGAKGSGASLFYGFGVHLNIEVADTSPSSVLRPFYAYALTEAWLRWIEPIDATRRVLPFTGAYPGQLIDRLAALWPEPSIDSVISAYLDHAASRNHGLDMLPLFASLDADRVCARMGAKQKRRPTFHFRLPDCRIDEPGWSLDRPWRIWLLIEHIATYDGLLTALVSAWLARAATPFPTPLFWMHEAARILGEHGFSGKVS